MREGCHVYTSQHALGILREVAGKADLYLAPELRGPTWMPGHLASSLAATGAGYDAVAFETGNCDHQFDIELVDVDGGLGDGARDNPHKAEWAADDDEPHHESEGHNFTAYSHFIDIRKGQGVYDDFDGYSYSRGSASVAEHEQAAQLSDISSDDSAREFFTKLGVSALGMMADEGMAWWFNDEYVHAPGQPWYRPGECSSALERYTHVALHGPGNPRDHRGGITRFETNEAECRARFPLAKSTGGGGLGFPYSVFTPVDNLALANWRDFVATGDQAPLGRVLHGVQDATIPHHAAGTCGNFHRKYEKTIEDNIVAWATDAGVRGEVKSYVAMWDRTDPEPPTSLKVGDERSIPAENWEIDQLVTWVALHAYDAYANVYGGFASGFAFNDASARSLVVKALAMSAHILRLAARKQGLIPERIKVPIRDGVDLGSVDVGPVSDGDGGDDGRGLPDPHIPGVVVHPMGTERGPRGGVSVSTTDDSKLEGYPTRRNKPTRRDHRNG